MTQTTSTPVCTVVNCPCTSIIEELRSRIVALKAEVVELEAAEFDYRKRPGDACNACGKGRIDERFYCNTCGHDAQEGDQ